MTGRYFGLLSLFVLSILHVPLVNVSGHSADGGGDAIGLFDLVSVGLCIVYFPNFMFARTLRADQPALLYYLFLLIALISFFVNAAYSGRFSSFGFLVILKNIQYIAAFYFFWLMMQRLTVHQVASIVAIGGTLFVAAGMYELALGRDYRLGFVWKDGEASAQPAGYFLAICLLFLFFYLKSYRVRYLIFYVGIILFLYLGLILTFSRTNNLAFIICAVLVLFYRAEPLKAVLTVLTGLALIAGASTVLSGIVYGEALIAYLLDPSLILQDSSFHMRYHEGGKWFGGLRYLSENLWNVWLGVGFGTVRVVDGLLPQVFYSSGIIGTALYAAFFMYAVYRYRNFYFSVFVCFVFLNGVGSEGVLYAFRGVIPGLMMWAALIHFGCRNPVTRRRVVADTPAARLPPRAAPAE